MKAEPGPVRQPVQDGSPPSLSSGGHTAGDARPQSVQDGSPPSLLSVDTRQGTHARQKRQGRAPIKDVMTRKDRGASSTRSGGPAWSAESVF